MTHQPSTIRRAWLAINKCKTPGRLSIAVSYAPEAVSSACMVQLLTRGNLPEGHDRVDLEVVSDPSADPSLKGKPGDPGADGLSAYQLARQQGYGGTLTQWLASLVGAAGASAYDLARAAGYGGTQTQWLASLKGDKGDAGTAATTLLGTLTIGENIIAAVSVGLRRLTLTTPSSWGVAVGQDLIINAVTLPSAAYALHDVIVTDTNKISVGITTPALAVLSSYSIPCRVRRLN